MSLTRWNLLFFALLSAISLGGYLVTSRAVYSLGFPLDDAWIHQTYARNLAERGEWAFQPGDPSGGSTSPLWSGLLGLGHWLGLSPLLSAYLPGWVCLFGLGVLGMLAFRLLRPESSQSWAIGAGALLVLEWRMVWAAGSGMETLLFALMALAACAWLIKIEVSEDWRKATHGIRSFIQGWFGIGALVGLSAWVRPDGLTLVGPALLIAVSSGRDWGRRVRSILWITLGFCLLFLPYLVFNRAFAGAWWPTTFYAKQAEYAILLQIPLLERLLYQVRLPLVGAGALLLPGFVYTAWIGLRRGEWGAAAGVLWVLAYLGSYALRLPVTYQHGRYAMPVIPVFCIWGIAGLVRIFRVESPELWKRVASRAWGASVLLALLVFWGLGARAYAWDVAVIQSEMRTAAGWISQNTAPGDVIAAHDIGALGYFADRRLLDLAGLVSPEVIPFIRDERALAGYLESQGARYLVTFPGWYPELSSRRRTVFQTTGRFSPALGGENMVVYEWKNDFP